MLVALVAVLTYAPSLTNGFALDDVPAVQEDERLRDPSSLPELMRGPYLTYMPAARSPYRPITSASYAISWWIGGGHPMAFHAVNVGLHALASVLLLSLLTALAAPATAATLGAAVFAAHPVHVEAVAGIVGRADVLSTLFCFAALVVYLDRRLEMASRVAGVSALYLLALGSKEGAVVLPLLVLLVEALRPEATYRRGDDDATADDGAPTAVDPSTTTVPPRRRASTRIARETLPFLVPMAVMLGIFLAARRAVLGAVFQLDVAAYIAILGTGERLTTAVANLGHLVRLLLVPSDLSPEYGPAVIMPAGLASPSFWVGAAVLGSAVGAVAWGLRWTVKTSTPGAGEAPGLSTTGHADAERVGAWVAAAVVWVAIGYALVSNFVIPMPMWLAERTLYLPSAGVGLLVVAATGACRAFRPGSLPVVQGVIVLAIGAGALHSSFHARTWASDEALFSDLAERHPESFRAQWWLGGRLVDAGDLDAGAEWLGEAVRLNPNSALLTLDYARALLLMNRSAEAEELLRPVPTGLHPSRSVFLAQSLIFQERLEEAASIVREGLAAFPDEPRLLDQARQLGIGG